jgi:chloride channel 7
MLCALSQVFFTPLSQALRLIIHLGEPLPEQRLNEFGFNYGTLGLFFVLSYILMMWTNGVGASTGMFVPALAVGATGESSAALNQSFPALSTS